MCDVSCTSRKQLFDQISGWYKILIDNRQVTFISCTTQEAQMIGMSGGILCAVFCIAFVTL